MLISISAFIVALGLLVTVHEFGHYWVARRCGIKVLRFSLGFGRCLWTRRYGPDGTEFSLSAIPLGGYVKMLDEREGEVPARELGRAFNRQSLGVRAAVVAAGPIANFLFAVLAYWAVYLAGVTGPAAIVGAVADDSPAARAGLPAGARIVAVDGQATATWEGVLHASMKAVLDRRAITLRVAHAGVEEEIVLDLAGFGVDDVTRGTFFERLGLEPQRLRIPPVIGEVVAGSPAARAGLAPGDRVLAADGEPVTDWTAWVRYVRARPDRPIELQLERDGRTLAVSVTPGRDSGPEGEVIGRIGAGVQPPVDVEPLPTGVERYGPIAAFGRAVTQTWDMSALTLRILGRMLFGEASVDNLSGPISIAQYAGQSASIGLSEFLKFLAVVSVSLGVLNLLPVPLLDGGHLMYYLIELVTRRPVSEGLQVVGQQVGLVLLLSLMGLAFYNDLVRIL